MSELIDEKSIISPKNYAEIKKMMLSSDEASVTVGLSILEQSDYNKSELYILLALKQTFKEAFASVEKFKEKAPELADKVLESIEMNNVDITKLAFKEIYNLAMKRNIKEEIEFMLDILRDELVSLLTEFGYEFTTFTDILIRPKGWISEHDTTLS